MQPNELNPLATHYEQGRILDRIKEGLSALGKTQRQLLRKISAQWTSFILVVGRQLEIFWISCGLR
jgi:hypothetical protein